VALPAGVDRRLGDKGRFDLLAEFQHGFEVFLVCGVKGRIQAAGDRVLGQGAFIGEGVGRCVFGVACVDGRDQSADHAAKEFLVGHSPFPFPPRGRRDRKSVV